MSYNGIGLQTPRGSGTSGHVQKNVADNKAEGFRERRRREAADLHRRVVRSKMNEARRNAGANVRGHDEKRKIEVKCMELRDELEDAGVDDAEIESRVAQLRLLLQPEPHKEPETGSNTEKAKGTKEKDPGESTSTVAESANSTGANTDSSPIRSSQKDSSVPYTYVPRYGR